MSAKVSAIVLTKQDAPLLARELIAAARAFSGGCPELWLYGCRVEEYKSMPVESVISIADDGELVVDRFLPSIHQRMKERGCDFLLAGSGIFGNELIARLGCLLGGGCCSSITGITPDKLGVRVTRRVFGMQIEAEYLYTKTPFLFSVDKDCFLPDEGSGNPALTQSEDRLEAPLWYADYAETDCTSEKGLDSYNLVLAGGRGLGSSGAAQRLEELGKELQAGVGSTRPAVLNAWFPMNRMIGVSGASVKPAACVTFGVSGCIPFVEGVAKSSKLIAINNDPEALIFRSSDIGLVGDCHQAMDELLRLVRSEQSQEK